MERNSLTPANVVSCIFTVTDDLDAEFPAVAALRARVRPGTAAVRARDSLCPARWRG